MLDALFADLGDVDQTLDVTFQAREGAKLGQARDHAFNQLSNAELLDALAPGVITERAQAQSNALLLAIDVDHLDLDFLPHFQDLAGMANAVPGELREVHQAVSAVDVDKSPEIRQTGDPAIAYLAFLELFDNAFLDGLA